MLIILTVLKYLPSFKKIYFIIFVCNVKQKRNTKDCQEIGGRRGMSRNSSNNLLRAYII